MPLFAILCTDGPTGLEVRKTTRPAHLDYLKGFEDAVRLAGPFLSEEGSPLGSLIIIDVADRQAAETFAKGDPYAKAGAFASVDIKPMNISVGPLAAG